MKGTFKPDAGAAGLPARPAAILLSGLSAAGKTTLARSLVRRLAEKGIHNTVLLDGEEVRARLARTYGHSLSDRDAVWYQVVEMAHREMLAGRIVVIASISHKVTMRVDARVRLQPFFEVHLDCPVEVCASRDYKGHYRRAMAAEYDCFIGVTHPYEPSGSPELRIDTSQVPAEAAEEQLTARVLGFLADLPEQARPQSMALRSARRLEDWLIDTITDMPLSLRSPKRRRQDLLKLAPRSKPIVKMERATSAQLMLLYGGMDAYISVKGKFSGMSPLDFLRQSGLFGRNLAWIRDPFGENFFDGVGGELGSHEALAQWTRQYIRSLPQVREVHALGYSSGCYGALMFGHLCRMQTVFAFSPRGSRLECAEQDRAWIKNLLSKHNGVTRYQIWYSYKNKRDESFAEMLADCPGVSLHPSREGGSRHSLIRFLAENRALRGILPPFLPAERRPAREVEMEPAAELEVAT